MVSLYANNKMYRQDVWRVIGHCIPLTGAISSLKWGQWGTKIAKYFWIYPSGCHYLVLTYFCFSIMGKISITFGQLIGNQVTTALSDELKLSETEKLYQLKIVHSARKTGTFQTIFRTKITKPHPPTLTRNITFWSLTHLPLYLC